jgi:HSP20 family molecular chaperone IbpA
MTDTLHTKEQQGELAAAEQTCSGNCFRPRFDIWETDDELILAGDLPGVAADDLEVRFEDRELMVRGKVAARHDGIEQLYREYEVGDFYRSFSVGESIAAEKIWAELKNGVVTIHLPKSDDVKPRRIEIKSGD